MYLALARDWRPWLLYIQENKYTIEGLISGNVDIVVGTHRLLQKDIQFRDLGLVIIDEEHRFGVTHKEKFKDLRSSIDVLTLTATPIPRTLQMGLTGIRDLSVINTAPPKRLAVRTQISRFDPGMVREIILREIKRGGQIFYVHNRVQSIESVGLFISKLVPEARVIIAHGKMREGALENEMRKKWLLLKISHHIGVQSFYNTFLKYFEKISQSTFIVHIVIHRTYQQNMLFTSMPLSSNIKDRISALNKLLPYQEQDFYKILK